MTIHSLDTQPGKFGSPPHEHYELPASVAGMFAAVKGYFWPAPPTLLMHANHTLADRAINLEGGRYSSTIKRVALVAAAAGIATAAYLVHSALYAHGGGDVVEPDFATPGRPIGHSCNNGLDRQTTSFRPNCCKCNSQPKCLCQCPVQSPS